MRKKLRIGIFGGTFNPPHNAHVCAAKAFLDHMNLDKLFIIPACVPPHKEYSGNVSAEDRLAMCRLAFGDLPNTEISDIEMKRGGRSYTYETLIDFKDENSDLFFLCGTDMFLTLDQWRCPDVIFDLATICVIRRESDEDIFIKIQEKMLEYKEYFGADICMVESEAVELSSTFLRDKLSENISIQEYIPLSVVNFINERGLY